MDLKLNRGMPGMPQIPVQLPMLLFLLGAGAIAFGVLLIWNEKLLVWLVAGLFFLVGALLLITGYRAKKMLG